MRAWGAIPKGAEEGGHEGIGVRGYGDADRPAARIAREMARAGPVGCIVKVASSQPATDGSVSVTAVSGSQ